MKHITLSSPEWSAKSHLRMLAAVMAAGLLVATSLSALGQAPMITSFSRNGELVCTNLAPGSVAVVEWTSSVTGSWTNNWAGLDSVTVDSNGTIRVSVPMLYRVRGVPINMALIPTGSFTMGDTFNEGYSGELPTHPVYLNAFYMDKYEVTKALWDEVYQWAITHGYSFENSGSSDGGVNYSKGPSHPVHMVNWYDCVKWCNARSEKEGRTPAYYTDAGLTQRYRNGQVAPYVNWSTGYRLPTEAEWEKAARGGASGRRFPWADGDTITHSRANYYSVSSCAYDVSPTRGHHPDYQSGGETYTSPVGSFSAHGYGLYDMAGNVWEWCWDWGGSYSSDPQTDPRGPASGSGHVIRGGGWDFGATCCRNAYRSDFWPGGSNDYIGFRSVLPACEP